MQHDKNAIRIITSRYYTDVMFIDLDKINLAKEYKNVYIPYSSHGYIDYMIQKSGCNVTSKEEADAIYLDNEYEINYVDHYGHAYSLPFNNTTTTYKIPMERIPLYTDVEGLDIINPLIVIMNYYKYDNEFNNDEFTNLLKSMAITRDPDALYMFRSSLMMFNYKFSSDIIYAFLGSHVFLPEDAKILDKLMLTDKYKDYVGYRNDIKLDFKLMNKVIKNVNVSKSKTMR